MSPDPRDLLAQRLGALRIPTVPQAELEAIARQEFRAGDDTVTAVVTGAGEIVALEISALATRGEAREQVGDLVVAAVNAALDAGDAARAALLPDAGDAAARMDELTEQFSARMDGLLGRLDDIGRRLPPQV